MCGRYKQASSAQKLREVFGIDSDSGGDDAVPAGLVLPGQKAPVIRKRNGRTELDALLWGFIPHWAQEARAQKLINARSETMAEKPSFREAFRMRRCLIPADGFYEGDARQTPKMPFDIRLQNPAPFAFAGVWDAWKNPDTDEITESFAIVTTAATSQMQGCHDRMPVMFTSPKAFQFWLSEETPAELLQKMCAPREEIQLALAPATDLPARRAKSHEDTGQGSLF